MRLFPVLAIALVVALAGCAKKNDDGGATTTTTTMTPTTSTTGSTSTTTTTTTTTTTPTTNTTPTTPTTPPPMEISTTADFSSNQGPPPGPPAAKAVAIPAGYTMGNLTVTWSCNQPPLPCGATPDADISVSVSGLKCTLPSGPQGGPTEAIPKCIKTGPVTAGDTKITYTGFGPVTAKIVLTLT